MDNSSELEVLSWQQAELYIRKVNPDLAEAIREVSPPSDCKFIKAKYGYGDNILKDAKVYLPYGKELYPIGHENIPDSINDALGYTSIPVGLPLNKILELYLEKESHDIPFTIYNPGNLISLWSALQFGIKSPHKRFKKSWSITAGSKSLYLGSKISDMRNFNRLKKIYGLNVKKPKSLMEQRGVFEQLSKKQYQDIWEVDVLFFSKEWFSEKNSKMLQAFKLYLYKKGWESTSFLRDKISFKFDLSSILSDSGFRINPYIIDTIDHLYSISYGYHPGFSVADNTSAPVKFFEEALIDVYGLENIPMFFGAQYFDAEVNKPAYYSLYLPTLLDFSPRSKNVSKVMDIIELNDVLNIVSSYHKENPDKYEAVDYWASTTQYDLFHTHQLDKYKVLNSTAKIPEQDSAIQRYLSAYPELSFDSTSSFLRGCVRISSK